VEAEMAAFLPKHAAAGASCVTGIGPVVVRQPRVRDRGAVAKDAGRIRFTPAILPPYARRSRSLEVLIPILYLKGIPTGDFEEALAALLGKDAPGLSPSTIARLKEVWIGEHGRWKKRDLSARRCVYVWADGIHVQARLEDEKQCILVLIGATPEGKKELLSFTDGARESAQDWRELLLDLKKRGLIIAPKLAIADGALGFWKAIGEVSRRHRNSAAGCTRPPTSSINCQRARAKSQARLTGIWMADARKDAEAAFDAFMAEVRKGCRAPDQGSRGAACLLRFSCRALEAPSNLEPHREHVCHRTPSHHPSEGPPLEQDGARDGVQARRGRSENSAPPRRT